MNNFTHDKKQKLANKINLIKDKKALTIIKDKIISLNQNIHITKNNNGYFLEFINLEEQTYVDLDKYIKQFDNEINNGCAFSISPSQMCKNDKKINKKFKYTNLENHILNRTKYENALMQYMTEENCYSQLNNNI